MSCNRDSNSDMTYSSTSRLDQSWVVYVYCNDVEPRHLFAFVNDLKRFATNVKSFESESDCVSALSSAASSSVLFVLSAAHAKRGGLCMTGVSLKELTSIAGVCLYSKQKAERWCKFCMKHYLIKFLSSSFVEVRRAICWVGVRDGHYDQNETPPAECKTKPYVIPQLR
ncbi:unnamed protein product [Vitrella brassicaformis CCMP3155]|uniref:Uncharacterized protein n=1 Tax=Vitrella brassicaformis (strain CCMP3155) TaxID=1169540 RepID=A0A0G4GDR0_VITBC|nr:unnamed protein product [Vitrella brassicaformis CCMP3155]|eukprot:CEM27558.1 unnamed protein product [Vitrella brassicaformis CCMP3155]